MSTKEIQHVPDKSIVDEVLRRIDALEKSHGIVFPQDYLPANAMRSAWLIIQATTDKNKNLATEVCDRNSIINAMFETAVQGLNPMKKQCYYVVYGKKLTMQRSYTGTEAVARRYGGLVYIKSQVIYDGDDFAYEISTELGTKKILKHVQQIENIDIKKIKGAYAIYKTADGTVDVEIMTKAQIIESWKMGFGGGTTEAHTNFTDQMAMKTVRARACKLLINASNDAALLQNKEEIDNNTAILEEDKNTVDVSFEDISTDSLQTTKEPEPQQDTPPANSTAGPRQKTEKPEAIKVEANNTTKKEQSGPSAPEMKF